MAMTEERGRTSGLPSGVKGQPFVRGPYGGRGQEAQKGPGSPHKLQLTDRESMTVTGVRDVLSFDVSEVLLETTMGMLCIRGSDLHVKRLTLDKGEVDVDGKIDSMTYSQGSSGKRQGESLLARLFR